MDLVAQANRFRIRSMVEYTRVADFLKAIKGMIKKVDETFNPIIEAARNTLDQAREQRDSHRDPLLNAEKAVKIEIRRYDDEQEKVKREKEEKAAAEAKAEEDRKRRAKEKQAEEWQKKVDAAKKKVAELRKKGKKEEAAKVEVQVQKAEEKVEERREEAENVFVPTPVIEKKVPQVDGVVIQRRWDFRIVNVDAIPRKLMIPDEKEIRRMVIAGGGKWKCAGIEIFQEKGVASGC